MKRFSRKIGMLAGLLALGLPVLRAENKAAATAAQLWAESVEAETSGDYAGAMAKVMAIVPEANNAYFVALRSGWLSRANQKNEQAIGYYQAAARLAPAAVAPLLGLALTYQAVNDMDKAARAGEMVLQRDPGNYTARHILGAYAYAQRDYTKAAKIYESLAQSYPEDAASLSGAAWSELMLRRKRDAAATFERLMIISPDYSYARDGYAATHDNTTVIAVRP